MKRKSKGLLPRKTEKKEKEKRIERKKERWKIQVVRFNGALTILSHMHRKNINRNPKKENRRLVTRKIDQLPR